MNLASAMREVHKNVPKNVKATGKTGKAKEAMLRAIAFSKAGESKPKHMHAGGMVKSVKVGDVKVKFHNETPGKRMGEAKHEQPDYRPTPIRTEPATMFPLDKHPAAMVIPKNSEGSPVPAAHSSKSAHPALADRAVEHFANDGVGGSSTRTRTAAGVTSRPGHESTDERKAHVAKMRAAKEDAFKK